MKGARNLNVRPKVARHVGLPGAMGNLQHTGPRIPAPPRCSLVLSREAAVRPRPHRQTCDQPTVAIATSFGVMFTQGKYGARTYVIFIFGGVREFQVSVLVVCERCVCLINVVALPLPALSPLVEGCPSFGGSEPRPFVV